MNKRPPGKSPNRNRRRRRGGEGQGQNQGQAQGQGQQRPEPIVEYAPKQPKPRVLKKYTVAFYETFVQAREDLPRLLELKNEFDQINIVIKADGNMDDPELSAIGKVFAGEAWTLIHKRRVDDGWYNEARE